MSLITSILKGAIGGFAKGGAVGVVTGALGGLAAGAGGGQNIARSLSRQVGCTILQRDANQARAMLAKGINPCTGQPKFGSTPTDVIAGPAPGATPIPVFDTPPAPAPSVAVIGGGGGALEFTTTGLIRNVIVNGRRVSRRKAAQLIKSQGIEVGARALGLSLTQAAQVVLQQASRPRRRRGLTGRQISEARRVIRTINSMQKSLGCTTRRRTTRRAATCR